MSKPAYVLLTAAKNEEAYIGEAIRSLLRQSVHPVAWFIMDDGSEDRTAAIVSSFQAEYPFIHLRSASAGQSRSFGSQYKALQAAYELARPSAFDFVGVHDADIAVERDDYYQVLLNEFQRNTRLGIAGGYIYERSRGVWMCRKSNSICSVAGGVQMFRRQCFEAIEGYKPLDLGGSDWLAQIEAKAAGWEVAAFPGLRVHHYRPTSSAGGRLRGLFKLGLMDASFGSHPLFELLKCGRRITEKPPLIACLMRLSGFVWWNLQRRPASIPKHAVAALNRDQQQRITNLFTGKKR